MNLIRVPSTETVMWPTDFLFAHGYEQCPGCNHNQSGFESVRSGWMTAVCRKRSKAKEKINVLRSHCFNTTLIYEVVLMGFLLSDPRSGNKQKNRKVVAWREGYTF